MVLRDSLEDKTNPSPPLTEREGGANSAIISNESKEEKKKRLSSDDQRSIGIRDTISPERYIDRTREKSPMQEIIILEQNWKKNFRKFDELLTEALSDGPHEDVFNAQLFVMTFTSEEILRVLFQLFDWERATGLKQEKLVDCARFAVQNYSGSREWVELLDVVAYVVCGEDGDVTCDLFVKIFQTKGVIEKLFKFIKDNDGCISKTFTMDLIANLTYARSREGFTQDNLNLLEKTFRQALGSKQELSFEDFKKIVTSKNSFFAERVFEIFDRDKSGSVSLSEFLDAMHQITGKSPNDKIKFLFRVYDLDGDGLIQREELEQVMKACMEENGMKFSDDQIEDLTVALFEDADTENRGEITYEALKAQLEKHPGLLENLSISIERWLVPPQPDSSKQRKSMRPYQLTLPYLRNNYVYISFLLFYLAVNLGLFIDRSISVYSDDSLPSALTENIYYVLARAGGQCLNFNCAFILILVLRQTLTFLRVHGATSFLPLDQHLYLHKMCGWFIVFYSALHTLMHLINFSTIVVTDTGEGGINEGGKLTIWQWLFTDDPGAFGLVKGWANPTGFILVIVLVVMVICSLPFVRKSGSFEVFYWTHLLYIVFWGLTILHAPNFWKWFIGPGVLFVIEKVYRWSNMGTGRGKTYISSGILLPSKVTHLVVERPQGLHFCPGDFVFVNIPAIAKYEWHPLTISSAPEQEGAFWLHIRSVGEWTNSLYSYFEKQQQQCGRSLVKKVSTARPKEMKITIEEEEESPIENENDEETEQSRRERKNGVINQAYDGDGNQSEEVNLDDISEENKSRPIASHLRKKKLNKTASVPDFEVKMKKRERNLFLRDNFKIPSEPQLDPVALKQAQMMVQKSAVDPDQNMLFPTLRSAAASFRYMRRKPMIVTLDLPEDTEYESDSEASTPQILDHSNPKATLVRLTSARIFGRRSTRKNREDRRKSKIELRERRQSRLREAESIGQCTVGKPLVIYIDGPYGAPSSHIFRSQHAVLIGTGIGVTPFASILQSIMHRYLKARQTCPKCTHSWTANIPQTVMNLRKVDFFWINRDQRSFEWFVNLLSQLEIEQAEQGGSLDRFLDMHMYITSALQRTDMKAVGLQLALELLHEKEKRDLITGLKTRTNAGRPNWDKVFKQLRKQKKGKITVFYCGPPALGRTLRFKCGEFGFSFKKEIF